MTSVCTLCGSLHSSGSTSGNNRGCFSIRTLMSSPHSVSCDVMVENVPHTVHERSDVAKILQGGCGAMNEGNLRSCRESHPLRQQRLCSIGQTDDEESLFIPAKGPGHLNGCSLQRMARLMDRYLPIMTIMRPLRAVSARATSLKHSAMKPAAGDTRSSTAAPLS